LLVAGAASAHDADVIFVELAKGPGDTFAERMTMTAATLGMLAPVDADGDGELTQKDLDARRDAVRLGVWDQALLTPCTRANETATLEPGYVALTAQFTCGEGELTQDFRWLMVLPSNYRVVMGQQQADATLRTLHIARPGAMKAPAEGRFGLPVIAWGVLVSALAALLAFILRRRRIALALLGLGLFAVGFWLVERLLA
jgi:hypothetical protein